MHSSDYGANFYFIYRGRGPRSNPDSESSPAGFTNQAYDDTDWKESVTLQDLMYSSDA